MRKSLIHRLSCILLAAFMVAGCLAASGNVQAASPAKRVVRAGSYKRLVSNTKKSRVLLLSSEVEQEESAAEEKTEAPEGSAAEEKTGDSAAEQAGETAGAAETTEEASGAGTGDTQDPADSSNQGDTSTEGDASADQQDTASAEQEKGDGSAEAGDPEGEETASEGGESLPLDDEASASGQETQEGEQTETQEGEQAQAGQTEEKQTGEQTELTDEEKEELAKQEEEQAEEELKLEEEEQKKKEEEQKKKEEERKKKEEEERKKKEQEAQEEEERRKREEAEKAALESEGSEVLAFDEEGPAYVDQGAVVYNGRHYEIRHGELFVDGNASDKSYGELVRLMVVDGILFGVLEDTEDWVILDRSQAAGTEAEAEEDEEETVHFSGGVVAHPENEIIVYRFARNVLKVNMAAAAGILANLRSESSFDPHASCIDTNGLTSYGVCQWNGGRFTKLKKYCAEQNLDYTTLEGQLDYLAYELKTSERSSFLTVKGVEDTAEGAYQAGYNWAANFERCARKFHKGRAACAQEHYWPMVLEWGDQPDAPFPQDQTLNLDDEEQPEENQILPEDMPENGRIPRGIWITGLKSYYYTGEEKTQDLHVYLGQKALTEGEDYTITYRNNTDAYMLKPGDKGFRAVKAPQAVVTLRRGYAGSKAFYFRIAPIAFKDAKVQWMKLTPTSADALPIPRIRVNGNELEYGQDFTVEFGDDSITVFGEGNYTGTLYLPFKKEEE